MNARSHLLLRGAAVTAAVAMVSVSALPAVAAEGDVQVVNTETVQVYTDATGAVESQRIYEQLAFTGTGAVELRNPVEESGLRNLEGFSGFEVENGEQVAELEVDGKEHLRTVSDYTGSLPLDVEVEYYLDGERVEPGDVVGESGELEVKYTVRNVTGQNQDVSFPDGQGGTVTKTVEVPVPLVGSVTTTLPSNFTEVASDQANMAGDGKGGTKLSFTLTLFPPIASDTAEFGYTARIDDGLVPRASITVLPVNPLENPTFKNAADSYQGGADTGIELADGATQIDENLLKLRDGAADLLAGLIQLRDGAQELEAGLAGEAAPGSQRLAAGADELNSGLRQLDDGAGQLAAGAGEAAAGSTRLRDGAGQLADGAGRAAGGSQELADGTSDAAAGGRKLASGLGELSRGAGDLSTGLSDAKDGSRALAEAFNSPTGDPDFVTGSLALVEGLKLISGGLDQLASVEGLPKALEGTEALRDGIDLIIAKLGSPDDPETLIGGIAALGAGLAELEAGAGRLEGGLEVLVGNVPAESAGLKGAKGGVDQVQAGLAAAVAPGGSLDQLIAGLMAIEGTFCPLVADPTAAAQCAGLAGQLSDGANTSKTNLSAANDGLLVVSAGLGDAITALETQLIPGASALEAGLTAARSGASDLQTGAEQLKAALATQIRPGLQTLVVGLTDAVAGVTALSAGGQDALAGAKALSTNLGIAGAGAGDLANGLVSASNGSNLLAAGARDAAVGGRALSSGLGQLDAGAHELSQGLGVLARGAGDLSSGTMTLEEGLLQLSGGAGQLADGTGQAAAGSTELADGARQLSDGLVDAANGSGRLAGGLEKAAKGAPKLEDGAQRLSDEGTSKLIEAGESTAQNYGELYATIEAGAERGQAEKMVYGAPEGAIGLAAYSFEIKGEDGEDSRNLARGLGGLALLAAGAGAFALRRRVI